jgi:signal peptidase II
LDQWSKTWADKALGTVQHPVPYTIAAEDDGRPLGEVIIERAGLDERQATELKEQTASVLTQLRPELQPDPNSKAFRWVNGKPRPTFYWAFHHETRDMPPRRVPLAQHARTHPEEHGNLSVQEYLKVALPYLSDDARQRVLDSHLYHTVFTPLDLSASVKEGQVYLLMARNVDLIPGFLQFKYAENPGAAWGFLSNQSEIFRKWFFIIVSLIALIVIGYLYYHLTDAQIMAAWAFAIIMSGAIGNFIDRIRFNYVIDFIDMYVGNSHWPTYNVADIAITVGVTLLLLELLFKKDQAFLSQKESSKANDSPKQEAAN